MRKIKNKEEIMFLGNMELKKVLKIKDGIAFAFVPELNKYERINGCEYFKKLEQHKVDLLAEIERHEAIMEQLRLEFAEVKGQTLDLEKAGYCPINQKSYTRVGGVVVGEQLTHAKDCKHRED